MFIEPRLILDERRYTAPIPALPGEWEGAEIAVFSDLQVGMWWANTGMVERVVESVVEEEPDVVLLGGDFVYSNSPGTAEKVETVMDLLDPIIDAGIPTVAVLGNHDYAVGASEELTVALEDAGIRVLLNEAVPLPVTSNVKSARQLNVVGIGPARPGLDDVEAAMADLPDAAPRILLMHNPTRRTTAQPAIGCSSRAASDSACSRRGSGRRRKSSSSSSRPGNVRC